MENCALGRITKAGDGYLRRLLVAGATSVVQHLRKGATGWLVDLVGRKPKKLAAVALANKMARIAWAVLKRGEVYRALPPAVAAAA